jgi:hypothetical protein
MKKIGILLLLCLLFGSSGSSPVWAYVPLEGFSPEVVNSPVAAYSISSSMADQDGKLNINWDTTVVLKQKDTRDVQRVDVAFTLLGSQGQSVLTRKVSVTRDRPWTQGEKWSYRLQQQHLGWPGTSTLVQVSAVFFTNGEVWENTVEGPKEVVEVPLVLPVVPVQSPSYIPPTPLPSGN